MTNGEWLESATQFLSNSSEVARQEAHLHARLLLDGATGLRFCHLIAPEARLEAERLQKLQGWLLDAARGRPIPFILGQAAFFGLEWEVDERVLIPRPETELLVETTLELAHGEAKIADLGTGSGIIAVSLQKTRPDLEVVALDVSPGALEIAARNAKLHGAEIKFVRGNGAWIAPIQEFAPFDAIVSNPPYIAQAEIAKLEVGVREFEPRLALDGGEDGLDPYREIARNAPVVMARGGFVALEMGAGQFESIRAIFEQSGWQVEAARRDLAGIERVLVARLES